MAMHPLRSLIPVLATVALACGAHGPADALRLTVITADRDSSRIVRFELRLTNVGDVPLYVPSCAGAVSAWLQVRISGAWGEFGGGLCHGDGNQGPLPIAPGQSVAASVWVGPGDAGEYRAAISVADDPDGKGDLVMSTSVVVP